MPDIAETKPPVPPLLVAGLLLAATDFMRRLGLAHPSATEILEATAAGRSQAYEYARQILALLAGLQRSCGRPATVPPEPVDTKELTRRVFGFVMEHPGSVDGGPERRRYSDDFRCFVLGLREQHSDLELGVFAQAVGVPLGTLETWIRNAAAQIPLNLPPATPGVDAASPRIQSILDAWKRWHGGFASFCNHVQVNLRIPYSRSSIAHILELYGARRPRRRPGHAPDEKALRGQFETFFPGAQWTGDGKALSVRINDKTFSYNFELDVDCHTAALVGASVRKEEDAKAVVEAFQDGVNTTGAPPLGLLLDNKPSNHTDEVKEALAGTIGVRATLGRPQNKAHVEGAFGLFEQTAPPLEIEATSDEELARKVLVLLVQIWARTLNHRPRRDRQGRSRVELYRSEQPTDAQIDKAKAALLEQQRKHELAEQTRRARQDPVVRQMLDGAFAHLGLQDPDGNLRAAIAGYSSNAVLAGLATFEAKRAAGTLPPGVDGRYLLGIVRNIAHEDEGVRIADLLLSKRIEARDLALSFLQSSSDAIIRSTSTITDKLDAMIDRALATDRGIDRLFWLQSATRIIDAAVGPARWALLRQTARRIHTSYRVTYRERLAAARRVLEKTVPLE